MHRTARRWTSAAFAALLLLLLGGCGLSRPAVGAGQSGGPTASATRVATTTATTRVIPTPGAVALRLGQMHTGVTDAVSVTVANPGRRPPVGVHSSDAGAATGRRMAGGGTLPARDADPVAVYPVRDRTDGDAEAGGRPPAADVASRDVPVRPALLRWRGGANEPSRPCPGGNCVLTDVHHWLAETASVSVVIPKTNIPV